MSAAIFKEWFCVGPAASRVIAALYEGGGEVVPTDDLVAASRQTLHGFRVSLVHLRSAMDAGSIKLRRDRGYWLTEVGLADCRAALADFEARAAA